MAFSSKDCGIESSCSDDLKVEKLDPSPLASIQRLVFLLIASLLIFTAFAKAWMLWQLPVAQPVWTSIMGKPSIVAIVSVDDELILDKPQTGAVTLKNRSNQPAKVIGMDRSCRCFELADDPIGLVIPALSS